MGLNFSKYFIVLTLRQSRNLLNRKVGVQVMTSAALGAVNAAIRAAVAVSVSMIGRKCDSGCNG